MANQESTYKGILIYAHDFTDYMGRNAHIGKEFATLGYDFYAMDMRGHGNSEGKMAYISNVTQLVDDFKGYMLKIIELYQN